MADVLSDSKSVTKSKSNQSKIKKQATTKILNPEDAEAKKDSNARKASVNKVCKKLQTPNILEQYDLKNKDKKFKLQRFNVFHHLIVNEKYKVLFCFIPKVGCSNMKRIFVVMEGLFPSIEKTKPQTLNRDIVRLDDKKFTEEQRKHMLKNYYKFMLVRDPFERLISAYRNKWQNKVNVELHAILGKQIVEKYRYNNSKTVKTGDDVTFHEYVRYLINTPPDQLNEHWMPYEDLCRPCNVDYNFIGSVDTINRDVQYAMRQIHANVTKYHVMKVSKGALTNTKKTAARFLQELPREHFDKLLAVYKRDHELFGYSLPKYDKLNERYPT